MIEEELENLFGRTGAKRILATKAMTGVTCEIRDGKLDYNKIDIINACKELLDMPYDWD